MRVIVGIIEVSDTNHLTCARKMEDRASEQGTIVEVDRAGAAEADLLAAVDLAGEFDEAVAAQRDRTGSGGGGQGYLKEQASACNIDLRRRQRTAAHGRVSGGLVEGMTGADGERSARAKVTDRKRSGIVDPGGGDGASV